MKKTAAVLLSLMLILPGTVLAADAVSSATVSVTEVPEAKMYENTGTLVIYFSTDDTVKAAALIIADAVHADSFEIVPEQPYSEADLAYYTNGRCDREQADDSARPGIAVWPESLEQYDTILIGYPIWHGQAPKILYTLLEGIDMSGKTIIPFCTSISSGAGSSAVNLQKLADSTACWADAKRISNNSSADEIRSWALSLNLTGGKKEMQLQINGIPLPVSWEKNESVAALQELAAGGMTVQMSMYGGFEQVGPIGKEITSNDAQIRTEPGDIVLYSGDRIVIFYGNNSWAYTRLGHVELTQEEMTELLCHGNATITITSVTD